MPRKRVEIEIRDGVAGKVCGRCKEWKPINDYNKDKRTHHGMQNKCKYCQSILFKKYSTGNETLLEKKREYHHRNREERVLYSKKYYKENQEKAIRYRETNRERYIKLVREWRKRNKQRALLPAIRRRARINSLANDLTATEQEEIISKFGGCALTGSKDFDMDHVIPITVGHGGTTYGNMIPLRHDLNQSKGNRNIFEWFEANRQRFNLSHEKFDILIDWLSCANEVTKDEYKSHVYWCHENPHSLEDLVNNAEGEAI